MNNKSVLVKLNDRQADVVAHALRQLINSQELEIKVSKEGSFGKYLAEEKIVRCNEVIRLLDICPLAEDVYYAALDAHKFVGETAGRATQEDQDVLEAVDTILKAVDYSYQPRKA